MTISSLLTVAVARRRPVVMRLLTESSSSGYQVGIERRVGTAGTSSSAGLGFGTYTTASTCFSAYLTRSLPDMSSGRSTSRNSPSLSDSCSALSAAFHSEVSRRHTFQS